MVHTLDMASSDVRRSVFQISRAAYAIEAARLGVVAADFPPLGETLEDLMANSNGFVGCLHEGVLAGVVELATRVDEIEICRLVVAPEAFRKGVASRLLAALSGRDMRLCVMTAEANDPAIRLYEKHGFRIVRRDQETVPAMTLVYLVRNPR